MTILFVSSQKEADTTLSQATINQIVDQTQHPVAKKKGIKEAIFPLANSKTAVYKVYNSNNSNILPFFRVVVNDQELTNKVIAEIAGVQL